MPDSNSSPDIVCKIVIIGEAGVGKTSVIRRFTDDEFAHSFGATVGELNYFMRSCLNLNFFLI